jgi:hypothetical protein
MAKDSPKPVTHGKYPWREYPKRLVDTAGHTITEIYAYSDEFVIYFVKGELYYECTDPLLEEMGAADLALAKINRLLPAIAIKDSEWFHENKQLTLELAADAIEMILCAHPTEGMETLDHIVDRLQTVAEDKRRFAYQGGMMMGVFLVWALYLTFHSTHIMPAGWEPWFLACALGVAGGALSVCLDLKNLMVSVNQNFSFLLLNGLTRAIVAIVAGAAALLAMRGKMLGGIVYTGGIPEMADPLRSAELFFCFLAGFSETFVPNLLKNGEDKARIAQEKAAKDEAKAKAQQQNVLDGAGQPAIAKKPKKPATPKKKPGKP